MDEIDQQIVALLRENARRSFQDIGKRVSLSAPAVKRRVDRLEEAGVVRGYSAVLDHTALGWSTHAVVSLFWREGWEYDDADGDKDDVQSLVHALMYQDRINIVGIASSTSRHR